MCSVNPSRHLSLSLCLRSQIKHHWTDIFFFFFSYSSFPTSTEDPTALCPFVCCWVFGQSSRFYKKRERLQEYLVCLSSFDCSLFHSISDLTCSTRLILSQMISQPGSIHAQICGRLKVLKMDCLVCKHEHILYK